jgi:cytochrome P450
MKLWGGLLDELKAETANGIARDCYVSNYLRQRAEAGHEDAPGCGLTDDGWLRDKLLAYAAATVLEAGSDTTASTMQSFLLFMISHPTCAQKVREEIDRVVGPDRMPTFEDEPNLPYLVACIKETLRRRPPSIMGK